MIKQLKPEQLKVGMYVIIPGNWLQHGFVLGEFRIRSPKEIEKIIIQKFESVSIDTTKSDPQSLRALYSNDEEDADSPNNPPTIVPSSLTEALHSSSLKPEERAQLLKQSANLLMERLLQSPTAANIGEAKKALHSIADHIIENDDTTSFLIKITSHDYYTYTHSVNVGILALALAKRIFRRNPEHNLQELGAGFFLHDIGKVLVDQAIINKNGRLTDAEMAEMRKHPSLGFVLLTQAEQISRESKFIVRQHHEKNDGTGYPMGLKGGEIHQYAKICAIADVYDALTSERSYKKALSPFAALSLMKEEMRGHFEKEIFNEFVIMLA